MDKKLFKNLTDTMKEFNNISWVCLDCGNKYGRHTPGEGSTWHEGECDVCKERKAVTEPRDFGYLIEER